MNAAFDNTCVKCESSDNNDKVKSYTVQKCRFIFNGKNENFVFNMPADAVKTSSYVVHTSNLRNRKDARIHLSGAKNNRVQSNFVSVKVSDDVVCDCPGVLITESFVLSVMRTSVYWLTRIYLTTYNTKGFKCQLYENPTRSVIWQYIVNGDPPTFVT